MSLLVANTDRAVDQVTDIAVNSGGCVVSSRTWFDGEFKFATLTINMPGDGSLAMKAAKWRGMVERTFIRPVPLGAFEHPPISGKTSDRCREPDDAALQTQPDGL